MRTDGFQDIRTKETFSDFDLEFDWKLLKGGNSGVKYLIHRVDEWTNRRGGRRGRAVSNTSWRTISTRTRRRTCGASPGRYIP